MKKLVLTILVTSVVSGSLFAEQNYNMSKEECFKMHKKVDRIKENGNKKDSTFEKHLKILQNYEHQSFERSL